MYHGHFHHLSFPKKGSEICEKVNAMIERLVAKIEERKKRIAELAAEAKLATPIDVLLNIQDISRAYSGSPSDAGLGLNVSISSALTGEIVHVNEERKEVEQLQLISRNLPANETFSLDFSELTYFGF